MKLYDIPIEAMQIEQELADNFGEITPEIEEAIARFLRDGKDKIEAAAVVVRSLESDAEICRDEARRLTERAGGLEKGSDRLKGMILAAVDLGFGGKVKTEKFTVWGQNAAPSVSFDLAPGADPYVISVQEPWCIRMRDPELDKVALKEAHKAGRPIPAEIVVVEHDGTRFLRIK